MAAAKSATAMACRDGPERVDRRGWDLDGSEDLLAEEEQGCAEDDAGDGEGFGGEPGVGNVGGGDALRGEDTGQCDKAREDGSAEWSEPKVFRASHKIFRGRNCNISPWNRSHWP